MTGSVSDPEGRQELVRRLYDTFFAHAFKKTVDKLGIVYTPVQIVDFILRSADEVLRKEFDQGLTDHGVHILDGFTGTGTFMVRLLELDLIKPHDLARKYAKELHANEILLLAYYIAAVNIETTYLGLRRQQDPQAAYESFPGLILTDTFQSWEDGDRPDLEIFPENNERLEKLRALPITVIVGNPPYSSGQDSANDNNQNEKYPSLDAEIRSTYADKSTATLKNSLYDSYIRAIKWATLRIDRGVIGYVTNGGFLDSNTADGLRKALTAECSDIYIYNLRGNQRTAGEQSRKEGGKVFGGGSRATVAITILVKNPEKIGPATLHYTDVGDYLTAEQKLHKVSAARSVSGLDAVDIVPNEHGDWLSQRRDDFERFLPVADKANGSAVLGIFSGGLNTSRDSWNYNFSRAKLEANVQAIIGFYNSQIDAVASGYELSRDPTKISWDRVPLADVAKGKRYRYVAEAVTTAAYRPFCREWVYPDRQWNNTVYRLPAVFPNGAPNIGFYLVGAGSSVPFSALMLKDLPDRHVTGASSGGNVFTRWSYEGVEALGMFDTHADSDDLFGGYRRLDNVTDDALKLFRDAFGSEITRDDIFFYTYGLLHSPEYRESYASDLKKMLPRIPLVQDPWPFVRAGRDLSEIHVGYESETPYPRTPDIVRRIDRRHLL